MVDVSKQSTFPPLLCSYNSQVPSRTKPTPLSRCSDQLRSLVLEHQKTMSKRQRVTRSHRPHIKRPSPIADKAPPRKSSLEILNKRLEEEAKRKEHEKAENTLRAWDVLMRREKDQKYQLLQQRVKIQRELIEKNDELASDLRARADLERLEKAQSLRNSRREFANELKAHYQRVQEHKRKISKKMQEMQTQEEDALKSESVVTDASAQSKGEQDITDTLKEQAEDVSSRTRSAHETMLQLLGVEKTKSINTMWDGMKTDSLRRISPVVRHSKALKQVASPSIKQCLDIYEQPTARDRFTGKPIPLSDIIEEANLTRGHQLSAMNNTLELLARNAQKKAELMLEHKNTFAPSTSCNPKFYLADDHSQESLHQLRPKLPTVGKDTRALVPKRHTTSEEVKKHLPSYLTSDGDLVSGSLEEFGEQFYCAPSRSKRTETHKHTGTPVFLTDLHERESHQNNGSTSLSDLSNSGSQSSLRNGNRWQPLSTSALSEHRKVKEVAVSGLGHLAHGKYCMWKPATCVVETNDS